MSKNFQTLFLFHRPKPAVESIVELSDDAASRLGNMLQRAITAIDETVHPERVYVVCLAELNPRIHFHLFPRTTAVTNVDRNATGRTDGVINGLEFMHWVRSNLLLATTDDETHVTNAMRAIRARLVAAP